MVVAVIVVVVVVVIVVILEVFLWELTVENLRQILFSKINFISDHYLKLV